MEIIKSAIEKAKNKIIDNFIAVGRCSVDKQGLAECGRLEKESDEAILHLLSLVAEKQREICSIDMKVQKDKSYHNLFRAVKSTPLVTEQLKTE